MIVNGSPLNTTLLNGQSSRTFGMSGYGIGIEKEVIPQNSMISYGIGIEKTVQSLMTSYGIGITKYVRDATIPDFITRNGFTVRITLGGAIIPSSQICGTHTITRRENDASILDMELQPPSGTLDLFSYEGKSVTYDIVRSTGSYRIFTGKVNIPTINLINKRLKLNCTDNRQEQIEAQATTFKNSIGYYAPKPGDTVTLSVFDEVSDRLETVPYSLDFNSYGVMTYTPWAAKASADFVLSNSQVYYDEPKVTYNPRHNLTNTVRINFSYRFPRLWQQVIQYQWTYPHPICTFLGEGHSSCTRPMVEAAISGTGWQQLGTTTYDPPFTSGWYYCSNSSGTGWVGWSTIKKEGGATPKTTKGADGSTVNVLDSNGNQVYDTSSVRFTDYTKVLTNGAYFKLQKKFAQTITESYTLTVSAPTSVTQYGVVSEETSASVDTDYDTNLWENDPRSTLGSSSQYIDQEPNISDFNNQAIIALNKAKTKILSAHRGTYVSFRTPGWEAIDLQHTVELSTDVLDCKGKVRAITHTIDISDQGGEFSTYVELAISRSSGSTSPSAITPPTRITDNPTPVTRTITLQSHYGQDPDTTIGLKWNGMIGNAVISTPRYDLSGFRYDTKATDYQTQFRVDTPSIDDQYRNEKTLTGTQGYDVSIPDDDLEVTL